MTKALLTLVVALCLGGATVQASPLGPVGWPDKPLVTSCQYNNNINLMGPDNGVDTAVFRVYQDPHDFDAWQYVEVLLCKRPGNTGAYAIVTDANRVSDPPQEIVSNTTDNLTFMHLVLNTGDTFGKQSAAVTGGEIELILTPAANGNPENMWVFRKNPNMLGGMPTLESSLQVLWGNW